MNRRHPDRCAVPGCDGLYVGGVCCRCEQPFVPVHPRLHPMELEPHYTKHVAAMTHEQLTSKSDIAEQLAWRDRRIELLWQLLDDIDSLGDLMKPESSPYFRAVQRIADKRRLFLVSLDGQSLQLPRTR